MKRNSINSKNEWVVGGFSPCRVAPGGTGSLPTINQDVLLVAPTLAEIGSDVFLIVPNYSGLRLPPKLRKLLAEKLRRSAQTGLKSSRPHKATRPLSASLKRRSILKA
jgi:hypothetical protein